jgi:MSHA biogenesis protein MshJ
VTPGAAIDKLRARVDARTRRERLLLGGALLVVVLLLWEVTLRAPLSEQQARAQRDAARITQQTQELRTSVTQLEGELAEARDSSEASRLERLRERHEAVDERLSERTQRLISPEQMVEVLRSMVSGDESLALVGLENQPVEPLIREQPAENDDEPIPRVYRHGIEVTLEGDYFALLTYLQRLEGQPWAFQWQSLDIERIDYPKARATLSLATLSLAEDWIGV